MRSLPIVIVLLVFLKVGHGRVASSSGNNTTTNEGQPSGPRSPGNSTNINGRPSSVSGSSGPRVGLEGGNSGAWTTTYNSSVQPAPVRCPENEFLTTESPDCGECQCKYKDRVDGRPRNCTLKLVVICVCIDVYCRRNGDHKCVPRNDCD